MEPEASLYSFRIYTRHHHCASGSGEPSCRAAAAVPTCTSTALPRSLEKLLSNSKTSRPCVLEGRVELAVTAGALLAAGGAVECRWCCSRVRQAVRQLAGCCVGLTGSLASNTPSASSIRAPPPPTGSTASSPPPANQTCVSTAVSAQVTSPTWAPAHEGLRECLVRSREPTLDTTSCAAVAQLQLTNLSSDGEFTTVYNSLQQCDTAVDSCKLL